MIAYCGRATLHGLDGKPLPAETPIIARLKHGKRVETTVAGIYELPQEQGDDYPIGYEIAA